MHVEQDMTLQVDKQVYRVRRLGNHERVKARNAFQYWAETKKRSVVWATRDETGVVRLHYCFRSPQHL